MNIDHVTLQKALFNKYICTRYSQKISDVLTLNTKYLY